MGITVRQLADEWRMDVDEVLEKMRTAGIYAKNEMSTLDGPVLGQARQIMVKAVNDDVINGKRIKPKVIRRRRPVEGETRQDRQKEAIIDKGKRPRTENDANAEQVQTKEKEMEKQRVAFFIDWENMKFSAANTLDSPLDIITLKKVARRYGTLTVARAYANWSDFVHEGDAEALIQQNIEPVYAWTKAEIWHDQQPVMFKNSVDLRLACDCIELMMRNDNISVFVIGSGDGDLAPVANKLMEAGKKVVAIAIRGTASNRLGMACDQMVFYEDVIKGLRSADFGDQIDREMILQTFSNAVSPLFESGETINLQALKEIIRESDPDFEEEDHGIPSFRHLAFLAEREGLARVDATTEPATVYPPEQTMSNQNKLLPDAETWQTIISSLEPNVAYSISALKDRLANDASGTKDTSLLLSAVIGSRALWIKPTRYYDSRAGQLFTNKEYMLNMSHPRVQVYRMSGSKPA